MKEGARPVVIFDQDCRFCCKWVERWKESTGDRVEYIPGEEAESRFPDIPPDDLKGAVQFLTPEGARHQGAGAVFRLMAYFPGSKGLLARAHKQAPLFRALTEAVYAIVAANRQVFSRITASLWGRDVRRPTFVNASEGFLKILAVTYGIAFLSYAVQARGLVGTHGILPAGKFLEQVREAVGAAGYWLAPTVLWLGSSDMALLAVCAAGFLFAGCLFFGWFRPLALAGMWVLYLSLVTGGQIFYAFQWDGLLLEAGFLALFLTPWRRSPGARPAPSSIGRLLLLWLLFRLMLSSGVVKLMSGDPAWHTLTALDYHYWTQPLPNPMAWYAAQLPQAVQKLSALGMFAVELILPFFLFLPRRPRMLAFWGIAGLQALIALTGNYGFFNLLTFGLCLLLVEDRSWPRWAGKFEPAILRGHGRGRWLQGLAAAALILLSLVPLCSVFGVRLPSAFVTTYSAIAPLRTINSYGLFAVMTTERPEIIVQGSNDGFDWKTYTFRWKPGPLNRPPLQVAPFMPRLDWQMWFAALGSARDNPWFLAFLQGLLEGKPEVLALLEKNPFDGKPPMAVRALLDDYTFSDGQQKKATGNWWRSEPRGIYVPEVRLAAGGHGD